MDDLVTWLRAQLDVDEQGALNARDRDEDRLSPYADRPGYRTEWAPDA